MKECQKEGFDLENVDAMQFDFMPGRGTTNALLVVRRMQEEHRDKKKKLSMCLSILKRHLIEFQEGYGVDDEKEKPTRWHSG